MSAVRVLCGDGDGNGFIVSSDGYILTAAHNVTDAPGLSVILFNQERLPALLVAVEPSTDLALLKIGTQRPLPPVRIAPSWTVAPGNRLFIVGYDPVSEAAGTYLSAPEGSRRLRIFYPSVLPTALVNAGHDNPSKEGAARLFGLVSSRNAAVRPGFSGSMPCKSNGGVVGHYTSELDYGGYGGDVASSIIQDFLRKHKIKRRWNPFWQMPLYKESLEPSRGWVTLGLASFMGRFGEEAEIPEEQLSGVSGLP
ncbi:hypothetical protein BH11ARM2_BH11ARM2_22200 [soil metagenome]